eukprot:scaffold4414_cov207-Skeletonema_dohrnii-CCMP3373.AAC.1
MYFSCYSTTQQDDQSRSNILAAASGAAGMIYYYQDDQSRSNILAAASGAAGMIYYSQDDQSRSSSINESCSFHLNKVTFPSLQYNTTATCEPIETEEQRFQRMLEYHRERIGQYRKEWEYRADNGGATTATKTPSRSWPDN